MELKLAGAAGGAAPQEFNLRVQVGDIQPIHSFAQQLDGGLSAYEIA